MDASIIVQVIIMGQCVHGMFRSCEGDSVVLRVAGMGIGSCISASCSKHGFNYGWNGHGLAMGQVLAMGQLKPVIHQVYSMVSQYIMVFQYHGVIAVIKRVDYCGNSQKSVH
jgi:hypothetical protein